MKPLAVLLAWSSVLGTVATPATADTRPTATTEFGAVRGQGNETVETFRGIPFAAPPVGDLRWHAPVAAKAWPGVRAADAFGHDCMQKPFPSDAAPLGTEPAEDCLTLNVWRPAGTKAGAALPVVVWIYGGGFVNGGSSPAVYDGSAFARAGVMFVSFNYRLGRFGFFAHPALVASHKGPVGNWGLMDQQAALKWVQRNIGQFGGDAKRVTIIGESAGGFSVTDLLGAPAMRGTFARAVIMSGGGRADGPLRQVDRDLPGAPSGATIGRRFAESVGVTGTNAAALARLRALPAATIVGDLNLATLGGGDARALYSGSMVDGVTMTGSNEQVFDAGRQARVPVMIGATSADIGFLPVKTKEDAFARFGANAAAAHTAYDPQGTLDRGAVIGKIGSDTFMVEPARYLAGRVTAAGQKAYLYRFSYVAGSMSRDWKGGAPHATDIPYFFDTVAAKYGDALTPADAAMARAINAYVVGFAKTGVPAAAGLPAWPAFAGKGPLMDFAASGAPVVGADPWIGRLDLVEGLAGK